MDASKLDLTNLSDARRMLVKLLQRDGDGPILGLDDLSKSDKLFLTATCATIILASSIAITAGFNKKMAREGLKLLHVDECLDELCDNFQREMKDAEQRKH